MTPGVAIVGCGLIGHKRARALGGARLTACADLALDRAEALACTVAGAAATDDWRAAVDRSDVDLVVVSTVNDSLAEIARAAVEAGKHVLVEKPAGRSVAEIDSVIAAAASRRRLVRVGFNHRYHPALRKARELFDAAALGEMMFVRDRYGHGGRPGYDREWRSNPDLSGGGELIDQGVHLIDLARWFLGDRAGHRLRTPTSGTCRSTTTRSCCCAPRARRRRSCTSAAPNGRTSFSLEIYGKSAKLQIDGPAQHGVERLTFYEMLPEMVRLKRRSGSTARDRSWPSSSPSSSKTSGSIGNRRRALPTRAPPRRRRGGASPVRLRLRGRWTVADDHHAQPLRITLGGRRHGPPLYRQHGGFLIAAAIDKYVRHGDAASSRASSSNTEARTRREDRRRAASDHP
jgi:predicted dehydrogenase